MGSFDNSKKPGFTSFHFQVLIFLGILISTFVWVTQAYAQTDEENETCFNVSSRRGWQTFKVSHPVADVNVERGGWSVDTRSYSQVGNEGHQGSEAERLAPFDSFKYNQSFPFGALLMNTPETGVVWLDNGAIRPYPLPGPIISPETPIQFRINDADNALGDNGGYLRICLGDAVG